MNTKNGLPTSTGNSEQFQEVFISHENHEDTAALKKSKIRKRESWSKNIDFFFACVGLSVGLGNVWRFPFLCYRNGGGAFLIPYVISAFVIGVPVVILEACVGQFMAEGGVGTWKICPLFQGLGLATTIIVALMNCYYIVVLAYAFYYLFSSFSSTLPWSTCDNDWNSEMCTDLQNGNTTMISNTSQTINTTTIINTTVQYTDSVTEYWERRVLNLSEDISISGPIKWDLALCLLLSWVVVYLCICKGIKSSGKVMYVTATSPYVLISILLVRGVTLEGASKGLQYYLLPEWEKVQDPKVWVDAGTQIFYSYATGLGILTALGSYNKFKHNCLRDALIVCGINSGTSIFAGFVIFSTLGFMAHKQGMSVDDVAESGPGLIFIAYPAAISQMPAAPVWAILFFCMVLLLGLDSQFMGVESVITSLVDYYPQYIRVGHRKEICVTVVCSLSFFVGLSMVTDGGMYVFQLFDFYSAGRIVLLVGFLECIVVAWIYGVDRFLDNIHMMTGIRPAFVFKPCWLLLTPGYILGIFILGVISYSELTYKRKFLEYHYPPWAIGVGWMLALSSVVCVPFLMIVKVFQAEGSLSQRIRYLTKPVLKKHQIRAGENMSSVTMAVDNINKSTQPSLTHELLVQGNERSTSVKTAEKSHPA